MLLRGGSSDITLLLGGHSQGLAYGCHGWVLWSVEAPGTMNQGAVPLEGDLELSHIPA